MKQETKRKLCDAWLLSSGFFPTYLLLNVNPLLSGILIISMVLIYIFILRDWSKKGEQ